MHKKQPKGETFFSPRLQRLASFLRGAHLVFPEVGREKNNADERKCNKQSFFLFSNSRVVTAFLGCDIPRGQWINECRNLGRVKYRPTITWEIIRY